MLSTLPNPNIFKFEKRHLNIIVFESDHLILQTSQIMTLLILLIVPDRLEPESIQIEITIKSTIQNRQVISSESSKFRTIVSFIHYTVLFYQIKTYQKPILIMHQLTHCMHHIVIFTLLRNRCTKEQYNRWQTIQLLFVIFKKISQNNIIQSRSSPNANLIRCILLQLRSESIDHFL